MAAYSSIGRTRALYAVSFVFLLPILRLRRRRSVLLALLVMVLIRSPHFMLSWILTPRYFVVVTFQWHIHALIWCLFFIQLAGDIQCGAFWGMNFMDYRYSKVVRVSRSSWSTRWYTFCAESFAAYCIVSEQTDLGHDAFR